jgi:hypothetical protein
MLIERGKIVSRTQKGKRENREKERKDFFFFFSRKLNSIETHAEETGQCTLGPMANSTFVKTKEEKRHTTARGKI